MSLTSLYLELKLDFCLLIFVQIPHLMFEQNPSKSMPVFLSLCDILAKTFDMFESKINLSPLQIRHN